LENKVCDTIDAQCNHEVYFQQCFQTRQKERNRCITSESFKPTSGTSVRLFNCHILLTFQVFFNQTNVWSHSQLPTLNCPFLSHSITQPRTFQLHHRSLGWENVDRQCMQHVLQLINSNIRKNCNRKTFKGCIPLSGPKRTQEGNISRLKLSGNNMYHLL
jgi:hypothetical protein